MSHRLEQKQAARAERLAAEEAARKADKRSKLVRRASYGAVGVIAAALITLAVTLGGSNPAGPKATSGATGPEVGQKAPAFALPDAQSGKDVSLASLRGKKTMLFFSEGLMCQACMVQIADLEKAGTLEKQGIELLHVSTDAVPELAEGAKQYGITTPLLSDISTEMSFAYGMLGHGGMGHPQTNGHAFMLLDENGKVLWHRAYQEMYVKADQLLADMRAEATA